jgi:D-aspartate ligase
MTSTVAQAEHRVEAGWPMLGDAKVASLPPVIILGGEANALSVARDLGREGIRVYLLCGAGAVCRHSRSCDWIETTNGKTPEEQWSRFLLSPASDELVGAVVLSCSDAGLQVLIKHGEQLKRRFRLDLADPKAQVEMLDKLTTYAHAAAAGVPTPRFWDGATREQVVGLKDSLAFPVMVKPRLSHLFEAKFGRKHVIVWSFEQLLKTFDAATMAGLAVLLMEWIPGGDHQLCSYYTYLDETGTPLFDFTKRIIRRFPTGMGAACYHITDWVPQIVLPAQRLFRQVGLRGLANVEFKLDERDGQYKLIECNARFTASNCLVSASGCKLALFVYNRIVGRPLPKMTGFRQGMRLLDPVRDFSAFRELRAEGKMTFGRWMASLLHRQTFAYFSWTDPKPALVRLSKPFARAWTRSPGQATSTKTRHVSSQPAVAMEKTA